MITSKDLLDSIVRNKENKEVLLIKNFCTEVPSWEDFIKYINEAAYQPSHFPDPLPEYDLNLGGKAIGNVLIKQDFYFYVNAHKPIGVSDEILKLFGETFNMEFGLTNLYVNLSTKINNIPQHKDPLHNFYWQCQGSVEWLFNDISYLVEPGDMVYIPSETMHGVNFSMPRAAIGFTATLDFFR